MIRTRVAGWWCVGGSPRTWMKHLSETEEGQVVSRPLTYFSVTLAAVSLVCVMICALLTAKKYKKTKVMVRFSTQCMYYVHLFYKIHSYKTDAMLFC